MINELSKEDRRQPQAWKDIQSDQKLIHSLLLRLLRLTPFGQDQLFRQHRGHRRVRLQRFTVDMLHIEASYIIPGSVFLYRYR